MKKNIFVVKNSRKQKKLYFILIGLALISFIVGILYIFFISKDNSNYIKENITTYYLDYSPSFNNFFKSLFNNYIYLIVIWLFGISIIGIPLIVVMFMFKAFLFGFSLSSIFYSFGIKGILISIISLIINKLLFLIILLLITFYSISFSIKLFKSLFLKIHINFIESMGKYIKTLLICLISSLIVSLFEGFVSPYLLNLFNI